MLALDRFLEEWDPAKHPRGWHGRFGVSVASVRAERRMLHQPVKNTRTPRSAGMTEEHWRTSFAAHGLRGETLADYKRRATSSALANGLVRDEKCFFYKPTDTRHRHPLGASGFGVAVLPPRTELHQMNRPNADRGEEQNLAGITPRRQKYRRARTGVLDRVGYRTVGTHTGQRRATRKRATAAMLLADSPSLARFLEAATSAKGVRGAEKLHAYWTKNPKGLAKWADTTKPWTALRDHLLKFMDPEEATRTATVWFHDVFGFYPGSDLNRVTHGKPPRGKRIGPG